MPKELRLKLLGHLGIHRGGVPVIGFTSGKVQALLCYLAVTGQTHLRPALAGLLWGELPEANAQNNLRKALSNLRQLVGPHLQITRESVTFKRDSNYWLDVQAFEAVVTAASSQRQQPHIERLEEVADLYQGDFLAGFYVRQAPAFEEWVLAQRARLRELALQALHSLAIHHTRRGEEGHGTAIDYTTRLLALEPWREEAHRQLMLLLALGGQRGAALAQYQTCRQVLAQELAAEPAAETTRLYEQIRDGERALLHPFPAYLAEEAEEAEPPVFVARDQELARLDRFLAAARAGRGQVAFVTGGPGRGKTALLDEFARRAMHAHPDLLVASGKCNALSGAGDPYLPFRELLAMLTGDVEARWAAGSIGRDHARRLWSALPKAAQALAERGPHITDILVDGPALLARAMAATAPVTTPWLQRLREHTERQRTRSESLEQSHLFEQVTNTLFRLARSHPLLLIIDDLQWADAASTGLLFHLGRRLPGLPILVAGAYRPEEVPCSRDGARSGERVDPTQEEDHALDKVLAEFKGQFGDVWVDLARSDPGQDRTFIDAFLDTEPNRLGEGFRGALFGRTNGHPLFTVELLRAMQERQDLLQDDDGRWIEGPALHWEALPARVEGAIEQRIARLAPELRDLLAVASVEGEEFVAQVVARVQGREERQVLRWLSEDLERKHRLVRALDEVQTGERHLSRYRFGHVLFRDYLYGSLGPGERRLLHREVGTVLEELYQGRKEEIASRLVVHFAGDPEKERTYARLAGERAAAQYANEEAVHYLSRALALTAETDPAERFELLLAREEVYERQADREAILRDLKALEILAAVLADPRKQAQVELRKAENAFGTGERQQGIEFAKAAANLSRSAADRDLEARAHLKWGMQLFLLGEYDSARRRFEQGLALAREGGSRWLEAEILRWLWYAHQQLGDKAQSEACLVESQRIFQEVGDRYDKARIQHVLVFARLRQLEYQQARDHGEAAVQLSVELGDRGLELRNLHLLASVLENCGDYETARVHHQRVLRMSREAGHRANEAESLVDQGWLAHCTGDSEVGLALVRQSLPLLREIRARTGLQLTLYRQGRILAALGRLEEGRAACEEALELARQTGYDPWVMDARAGLASIRLATGETAQAMGQVEEILAYLQSGTLEGADEPPLVYLTCYRVLQAVDDARAVAVLEEGYGFLQEIAGRMTDEDLRRSFLENVEVNRELAQEYKRVRGER